MFSLNIITRELRVSSASLNVLIRIVGQIPFLKISCWEKEGNVFKHIVNSITHPTSSITCWAVRLLPQLPTPWVSLLHCTPSMAEPKPQDWTGRWLQVDGGLGVWSLEEEGELPAGQGQAWWSKQLGLQGLGGLETMSPNPQCLLCVYLSEPHRLVCELKLRRASLIGSQ